jgi:NAD(P)H dehydrogenase (quinone)
MTTKQIDGKILVTGASGQTGFPATISLLKAGVAVRALVRIDDGRAAALRAAGAEVFVGDLLNLADIRRSLESVSAAYFVYPIEAGLLQAAGFFAMAAAQAGVQAIVNMSQISARKEARSLAARDHWIAERVFDRAGPSVTHLRPTLFAQWLTYRQQLISIARHSIISLPFGNSHHSPIAAEDIGRLIAKILLDPSPHSGKSYAVYGTTPLDFHQMAQLLSDVIGRTITYVPVEIEDYARRLAADNSVSERLSQHILAIAQDYQNGFFAGRNEVIERITGHPPITIQEFLRARCKVFESLPTASTSLRVADLETAVAC